MLLGLLGLLDAATSNAWAGLIANGDFSGGNTDFITEFTYSPGNIWPDQTYDLVTDPAISHPAADSFGDHTTGTGLMMAVNGSTTVNQLVWSQSVAVDTDQSYTFTAWCATWYLLNTARLDVLFNSVSVGVLEAPQTLGVWTRFATVWNSGSETLLTIELRGLTTDYGGNDFTLDDLSLSPTQDGITPEPSTWWLGLSGAMLLAGRLWQRR